MATPAPTGGIRSPASPLRASSRTPYEPSSRALVHLCPALRTWAKRRLLQILLEAGLAGQRRWGHQKPTAARILAEQGPVQSLAEERCADAEGWIDLHAQASSCLKRRGALQGPQFRGVDVLVVAQSQE